MRRATKQLCCSSVSLFNISEPVVAPAVNKCAHRCSDSLLATNKLMKTHYLVQVGDEWTQTVVIKLAQISVVPVAAGSRGLV